MQVGTLVENKRSCSVGEVVGLDGDDFVLVASELTFEVEKWLRKDVTVLAPADTCPDESNDVQFFMDCIYITLGGNLIYLGEIENGRPLTVEIHCKETPPQEAVKAATLQVSKRWPAGDYASWSEVVNGCAVYHFSLAVL